MMIFDDHTSLLDVRYTAQWVVDRVHLMAHEMKHIGFDGMHRQVSLVECGEKDFGSS